jgi:hypothetical protein
MLGEIEVKAVKIPGKIISCYLPGSKTQFRKNVKYQQLKIMPRKLP